MPTKTQSIKIMQQFPNLFNPLLCVPLGSLPSLGATSSPFRRHFELLQWKLLDKWNLYATIRLQMMSDSPDEPNPQPSGLSPWSAGDTALKCVLGGDHCVSKGILGLLLPPREQEKEEKMVHKISITLKSRNICWRLQVRLELVFTSKKLASSLFRPSAK